MCSHMTSSLCTREKGERGEEERKKKRGGGHKKREEREGGRRDLVSLLIRVLILSDQGPNLMTSFNLITSFFQIQSHWGQGSLNIHSVHNNDISTNKAY